MKHVRKSVLLWYSARQMYDLVTQVQAYPEFLPWCDRAEVLEHTDQGMTARLGLAFSGLRHAFTTRNTHEAGRLVTVELVDGPFSKLEGRWAFTPVGGTPACAVDHGDAAEPSACRVELDLQYALRAGPLEMVLSPVFDRVANTLVDCFVQRAEAVYGAR
ncbi:MAG: type II toxin-antitoxin system RatA family toxin [Betaproteobacteria bacterium]|jgi:ribosome-associated toxin RatA of RatAB toxin-antitoxin module